MQVFELIPTNGRKSFESIIKTGDKINIIYNKNKKYKEAFSSYNVEVLELTSEKLYFLDKGLKCSRLLSDFEKDFSLEILNCQN